MPLDAFTYLLPSGATVEIENLPTRGPQDVAAKGDVPFETVLAPLGELCELVFEKLRTSMASPESVTIELGAAIKGKTCLVLVSGQAECVLKVILSWKSPQA